MSFGGERELWLELKDERNALLSAAPAEAPQRRLAYWAIGVSIAVFSAAAPFAKLPLPPAPAFLPAYQAALIVNDLITAVLLFGQFGILRRAAILVLASAYLFSSLMAVGHFLSFPGLFPNTALRVVGPQTTAWLYFLWHGGFPLFILAYAILANRFDARAVLRDARTAIAAAVAFVVVLVCALAALTTLGHGSLPTIMDGDRDAPAKVVVATVSWTLCVAALIVLWRRRPQSVLDLWLMVVLCAWVFDIALAAVLNAGRFDVGWYAGRVYGLLAASFVLMVLLLENGLLYAQLLKAYSGERRERQRVQEKSAELAAANKELDAFSYSVSHDLRAPLRHIGGFARLLEEDCGPALNESAKRSLQMIGSSVDRMNTLINDLLEFSRLGRQEIVRGRVDMAALAKDVAAQLSLDAPGTRVVIGELPEAEADGSLLSQVWTNLIGNAFKYSGKRPAPRVEIGGRLEGPETVYWVRDNGAGFDMRYADRLFGVFQRLHRAEEFPGTGVGLAIVQRIVSRHGGRVWAEGEPGVGAAFYFSLARAQ